MNNGLTKQVLTHLAALAVGLGIGYFAWNSSSTTTTAGNKKTETAVTPAPDDKLTEKGGTPEVSTPDPKTEDTNFAPKCGGADFDMESHLTSFAAGIEAQKLMYDVEDLSDCSGIFLRLMNNMRTTCSDFVYPNSTEHRDTRLLAKWFHDNSNMVLVNDIKNHVELIRPGAVLFYGQRDKVYNNVTIKELTSPNIGIQHVGVVTDITEKDGVTTRYKLFHGRTTGKLAGRTNYHTNKEKTKDGKFYPAYGNGRQQIVAISYITTKKPAM